VREDESSSDEDEEADTRPLSLPVPRFGLVLVWFGFGLVWFGLVW
jgi:hypothetical protein